MELIQLTDSDLKYVKKELLADQEGVCPICKKTPVRPVVDHSHKKKNRGTGLVRGVICSNCNVFLAKIENNCTRYGIQPAQLPQVLDNIISYLVKEHYPYIHPSEKPPEKILTKTSYNILKNKVKVMPPYRKGKFTAQLKALYKLKGIEPQFYGDKK